MSDIRNSSDDTEALSREKLATLCRMLGHEGLIGMFGHVSIRLPNSDRILISPGAGTEKTTIKPEDIFVFHIDGEILSHPGGEVPLEWRIHTKLHKDRPDAMCIAHLHAHHTTLLGIAGKKIKPVFLHGGFLCEEVPVWENPRLVMTDEQATSLSSATANHAVVQMRGHGSVVLGDSPESVFFACHFLEQNSRFQIEAGQIGNDTGLSEQEALDCAKGTRNERLYRLLWQYYDRQSKVS